METRKLVVQTGDGALEVIVYRKVSFDGHASSESDASLVRKAVEMLTIAADTLENSNVESPDPFLDQSNVSASLAEPSEFSATLEQSMREAAEDAAKAPFGDIDGKRRI